MCVLTHTKFQKVEFCLSIFHRNITNLISIFSRARIETYGFRLIYESSINIFLILAAEPAEIKFLKSREKPTLSDVLNFASIYIFNTFFFLKASFQNKIFLVWKNWTLKKYICGPQNVILYKIFACCKHLQNLGSKNDQNMFFLSCEL